MLKCQCCGAKFQRKPWPATRAKYCSLYCNRKAWRIRHKDRAKAQWKTWVKRNRANRLIIQRRYNATESARVMKKRWYIKHREERNRKLLVAYHGDPKFKAVLRSRQKANAILRRASIAYICACCHSRKQLHCHHINHDPLDNRLNNLMWLCATCHAQAHSEKGLVFNT